MADGARTSRLETALLESRLITSGEALEAAAAEDGLTGWLGRQQLLPAPLVEQAERGEPLRLGRYVVTGRLGKGGMGAVLRARDDALGREVALKVLRPLQAENKETLRARFRREALALARLSHPHIVRVIDLDEAGDVMFLVLELVEGRSLEERLRAQGPLSERDARRLLRQVAQAMSAAEAQGIVHRDLKPANVMWLAEGEVYKVCDFGTVRFREPLSGGGADAGKLTQPHTVIGTPLYMSPEQVAGREVDARSDMYSFGLTLHEALTGRLPFEDAGRVDQALLRRLDADVPSVRAGAPEVSIPFARLIAWMTERDRARRPASWRAISTELAALSEGSDRLRGSGEARRASGERLSARLARERAPATIGGVPVPLLVALALAVGAAIGGAVALLGG